MLFQICMSSMEKYGNVYIPYGSQCQQLCMVNNILQNIFFCVKQKKEIHTALEQHDKVNNAIFSFLGELSL